MIRLFNPLSYLSLGLRRTAYLFTSGKGEGPPYENLPYNINYQEHRHSYLRSLNDAKQQLSVQNPTIPRRKRRIYDRPRIELNMKGYSAWRLYDPRDPFYKNIEHGLPVLARVMLAPKWVKHCFGKPLPPARHPYSSSGQYIFEDTNLSRFLFYEYRNTTNWKLNNPNWDYKNQDHLPERRRLKWRVPPAQFWESEQLFQFRLNGTAYAYHREFIKWLTDRIEAQKTQESYDQFIDKKYGTVVTFNKKQETALFKPYEPMVMHVTQSGFLEEKNPKKPPKDIFSKKLPEEYRIDKQDSAMIQAAQKSAQ